MIKSSIKGWGLQKWVKAEYEVCESKLCSHLHYCAVRCTVVDYNIGAPLFYWISSSGFRWGKNPQKWTYIGCHNLTDGFIKLFGVIEVDSDDMRPADVLLCIGMLRGHLTRNKWDTFTITIITIQPNSWRSDSGIHVAYSMHLYLYCA